MTDTPSSPDRWRAPDWPSAAPTDPPAAAPPDAPQPSDLRLSLGQSDQGDQAPPAAAHPSTPPPPIATPAPADAIGSPEAPTLLTRLAQEFVAWLRTLASAAVYATLIVTFGFQVARVEGLSMAPTLADQDRLIVNKLLYRLTPPRRSDIVMLYYPIDPDKSFVKRVIAEEGDTVRIDTGQVFVNDVPVRDEYVPPDFRSYENYGPQIVPEGYYFVMGDHRNNSSDSRHWGMVPKRYIIGKVQLRWWPIPTARLF